MASNPSPRIAVIGWGSLIWDLDDLAPKVRGDWSLESGPALPIEFSRISQKRAGALTAVIDPAAGEARPTAAIASARPSIAEAVADLAARERAPVSAIGWVDVAADESESRLDSIAAIISIWCHAAAWEGAVWTDLSPNFAAVQREPFSTDAAIRYLQGLSAAGLAEAARYITQAPAATDTPLRRALGEVAWWRDQVARLT